MPFEVEQRTFEAKLPELRAKHEGEFVLIYGTAIVGVFPTYKEAVRVGDEQIGSQTPFLVNWIAPAGRTAFVFSPMVGQIGPDDTGQKLLDEFDAQIRRDYGDLQTYVRKVFRLDSPPSQR
jgi:hypothetical protein